MIAAIYARKSTAQTGVDADTKSVARQIENARTFALAKGWRVADAHVYSDDAISGAELRKLVSRQRLLDAASSGRPPFQVLIMRDASRFSRRDGYEAVGELKQLAEAGVAIWFYQDQTRFAYGEFSDNVVAFVRAEMNAEYRRSSSKNTHEAMLRKARAGHVTGGAVFGYDNVRIDGHTERRINDAHKAVILQIFALCAEGKGYSRIAKQLNAERAVAPTPRRGQPKGWSPSNVREVVHRPLYRGEVIYNKTRRRNPDGATTFAPRPESEWLRVDRPELRIVPADLWLKVHARLTSSRSRIAQVGARRRSRDIESPYLLSGFMRCVVCGGGISVLDRREYGCIAFHKRGSTVCGNALRKTFAALDDAVLTTLRADVLRPKAFMTTIDRALKELAPPSLARELTRYRQELQTLDRRIANLTHAIAEGGQLTPLLDAMKRDQSRREELTVLIATAEAVDVRQFDRRAVEREVCDCLDDWRARLAADTDVPDARQALREMLVGPLTLTPDGRSYRFEGELLVGALLRGSDELQPLWRARGHVTQVATTKFSGIAA